MEDWRASASRKGNLGHRKKNSQIKVSHYHTDTKTQKDKQTQTGQTHKRNTRNKDKSPDRERKKDQQGKTDTGRHREHNGLTSKDGGEIHKLRISDQIDFPAGASDAENAASCLFFVPPETLHRPPASPPSPAVMDQHATCHPPREGKC